MKSIKKFGVAFLLVFFSMIGNTLAHPMVDFDTFIWIAEHMGNRTAIPGPGYQECDQKVIVYCVKLGRVSGSQGGVTQQYDFAWVPSTNTVFDDVSGTSIYNIDIINETYDLQINMTNNTSTFSAYSFQDIVDYYWDKIHN